MRGNYVSCPRNSKVIQGNLYRIEAGNHLFVIEAMKMETSVHANVAGTVKEIVATPGTRVEPHDLVVILEV